MVISTLSTHPSIHALTRTYIMHASGHPSLWQSFVECLSRGEPRNGHSDTTDEVSDPVKLVLGWGAERGKQYHKSLSKARQGRGFSQASHFLQLRFYSQRCSPTKFLCSLDSFPTPIPLLMSLTPRLQEPGGI